MRSFKLVALTTAIAVGGTVAATASSSAADSSASSRQSVFHARLTGYEEDPLVLSTAGSGMLKAVVNDKAQEISYRLTYAKLGTVTQSHIHFGGRAQSGGVSAFLCAGPGSGAPAGTPVCPATGGTVTGTIKPAAVVGPAGQGIAPGDFAALVAAIRAGKTYANVHTAAHPGGEIRGQLR
ncbi:CHRD domain-containing protein [Streptomyces sp. BPTC-684]|uniref:CHRD domain-containing protein n=1 Tax=Streptomyces sp. BPTC-684 TaxID=3043734 RepID=UPI0024B1F8DB|nr:CHRD domain-containing protein [Streptomyces sp. BPTC-684]WHM40856.1 CHRD domain-containing protein [Streptomyces sp. BPTC-684]